MKRLLSIELQKIWLNKASRVLTLTYFILLSFIALIASINFNLGPIKFQIAEMGIFNFPYIWHFNTYIAAIMKLFLAIIIVFIMTLILGYSFSSYTELSIVFSDLDYLLAFFVKLVGFFSFCLFLGILVKRSAFALGFLLVWNVIEGIAKGFLNFSIFPEGKMASYITQ